jgi:hypothetical protein
MSARQLAMKCLASLPDSATPERILSELSARFEHSGNWSAEDVTPEEWSLFVSQGLNDELNDPREDIYSLEDGFPIDVAR